MPRQQSRDVGYIRASEYAEFGFGGKSSTRDGSAAMAEIVPFGSCALTAQPWQGTPCCVAVDNASSQGKKRMGICFDRAALETFVRMHGVNPITGEKMDVTKDTFELNVARNSDGKLHCPISFKEFGSNSAIVAVKFPDEKSANVYSRDAIMELCGAGKTVPEPLTGRSMTRDNLVALQDSTNSAADTLVRDRSQFHFIKRKLALSGAVDDAASLFKNANVSSTTQEALAKASALRVEREKTAKAHAAAKAEDSTTDAAATASASGYEESSGPVKRTVSERKQQEKDSKSERRIGSSTSGGSLAGTQPQGAVPSVGAFLPKAGSAAKVSFKRRRV